MKLPHTLAEREFVAPFLKVLVPVFVGLASAANYFDPEKAPWCILGTAITMLLFVWRLSPRGFD